MKRASGGVIVVLVLIALFITIAIGIFLGITGELGAEVTIALHHISRAFYMAVILVMIFFVVFIPMLFVMGRGRR